MNLYFDIAPALKRFEASGLYSGVYARVELVLAAITRANTISNFSSDYKNIPYFDGFGSWLHPHNIFVSIYSFFWVFFSFTVFMLFFSLLILSFYNWER